MAIITQAAAIVVANTIRDEVIVNANTCLRVGGLLRDMVDSMWPGDHADTHLPGGTDALATGAPVSIGSINAEGNAAAFSRQDHVHAHAEQGGGNQHTLATTVLAGFMSAAQVVALGDASSHVAITNGNPHGTSIANIGQGTLAQLNTAISDFNLYSTVQVDTLLTGYVPTSRTLTAGNGLTGGGTLAADRTFAVGATNSTITVAADGIAVGTIGDGQITNDTISAAKLYHGAANSVVWSNGTASSWSTTPTLVGLTLTSATNTTLQITSGTSGIAALSLGDTDSSTRGGVSYVNATDAMLLRAGGAPIVRVTNADFSPYSAGSATLGGAFRWGASHFGAVTVTGGVDFSDSAAVDVTTINATAHIPRTTEVTLNSSGAIAVTGTAHTVDTYADAAYDTLTTITDPGWPVGTVVTLRQENNGRDVTIGSGGNINLPYGKTSHRLGHSSQPVQLIKCLSGVYSLMPPPEQRQLSVGTLDILSGGLNLNNSEIVGVSYTDYTSQADIPAVPAAGVRVGANGGNLFERSSEGGLWQLSPTAPPDICRVQRVIRLQDVASATTTLTLPELIPFVPESPALGGPYYGFFWVNVRMMCRYRGGATYTEHASLSSFIFRIYRPYGSSTYTISVYGMGADNVYHQHGGASFDYPRISSFSGSGTTPTADVWIVPGSSALYPGTYVGQLDIFGPINTGADGDWASI